MAKIKSFFSHNFQKEADLIISILLALIKCVLIEFALPNHCMIFIFIDKISKTSVENHLIINN